MAPRLQIKKAEASRQQHEAPKGTKRPRQGEAGDKNMRPTFELKGLQRPTVGHSSGHLSLAPTAAPGSLDDIKAAHVAGMRALQMYVDAGLAAVSATVDAQTMEVTEKAKGHLENINDSLKQSCELKRQVDEQHKQAMAGLKAAATEVGTRDLDPEVGGMLKRVREVAQQGVTRLRATYAVK